VLLTNENDLTQHFANRLLPDKNVPLHNKRYMAEADAFARSSGLSARGLWHSWEPGAPKLFLNDLEHRFDIAMMADLRRQGVKTPVATTSAWGAEPVSALPALTTGDLVDAHSYGGAGALERNPRFLPNIVDWPAAAHVPGVPLSVSEWNAEPFPTPDRHVLPLYVAATAAHQGWDALMHYAYAQEAFARNSPSNWNAYNDPSLLAMMPAAALLYRERHVAEATTTYVFDPGADAFFGSALSPASSVALRTAAERGKLLVAMPRTPALPWLRHWPWPKGAVAIHDPDQSLLPPDATSARSDSGELVRNWDEGVFTISTPRTQAALGWIGGRVIALPNVTFNLLTPNASVAVQSLDGAALAASSDLLVSVGTRSQPQPGWSAPFLVEPAAGSLVIRARPGLLACVDGAAGKLVPWPLRYADGAYTLQFDAKTIVQWFYLRPAGADNGSCRPGPSAQPGGR